MQSYIDTGRERERILLNGQCAGWPAFVFSCECVCLSARPFLDNFSADNS